jgi:hypothetical protein
MLGDDEAKAIVDAVGDEMKLAPIERLAVRLVAKHETQYGAGWDARHDPPRPAFGAGSNNMGAITTTSTIAGNYFEHGDSRFDPKTGKVVQYVTKFSRHSTPAGGFRELAGVLLFQHGARRENVAAALAAGSLLGLATAMRANRYFLGTKPIQAAIEDYRAGLARRYDEIRAHTGEDYFDEPPNEGEGEAAHSVASSLRRLAGSLAPLRQGIRGDLVGMLQLELGAEPDEYFGPKTAALLIEFQKSAGIEPDGICGAATWAALFERTHAPAEHDGQ